MKKSRRPAECNSVFLILRVFLRNAPATAVRGVLIPPAASGWFYDTKKHPYDGSNDCRYHPQSRGRLFDLPKNGRDAADNQELRIFMPRAAGRSTGPAGNNHMAGIYPQRDPQKNRPAGAVEMVNIVRRGEIDTIRTQTPEKVRTPLNAAWWLILF